jgi:hypothetical protein
MQTVTRAGGDWRQRCQNQTRLRKNHDTMHSQPIWHSDTEF